MNEVIDKNNKLKNIDKFSEVILELGVGKRKIFKNSITIDILDFENVDIVANLNDGLSFIEDSKVDLIYSRHVLEHIENIDLLFQEMYRVLKIGGKVIGFVPHFTNPFYYSDPTHKTHFGLYTLMYYSKENYFRREVPNFYNDVNFKIEKLILVFKSKFKIIRFCKRHFQKLVNSTIRFQEFYEENLCYLIPAYELEFSLIKSEKIK